MIKHPRLIGQRIYSSCLEAFEIIASALGCGTGGLKSFETLEFVEGEGDLCWCIEAWEDHIAVLKDAVDEVCDGGVF